MKKRWLTMFVGGAVLACAAPVLASSAIDEGRRDTTPGGRAIGVPAGLEAAWTAGSSDAHRAPLQLAQSASAGASAPAATPIDRGPWTLQVSGLVHHWLEERCKHCDRRTFVPGLGIERELSDRSQGNASFAVSAGVQTDS